MFNEQSNNGEQLLFGGKMQRRGIISLASDVRVGAAFEEETYGGFLPSKNRLMKRGSHPRAARFVDEAGVRVEQFVD